MFEQIMYDLTFSRYARRTGKINPGPRWTMDPSVDVVLAVIANVEVLKSVSFCQRLNVDTRCVVAAAAKAQSMDLSRLGDVDYKASAVAISESKTLKRLNVGGLTVDDETYDAIIAGAAKAGVKRLVFRVGVAHDYDCAQASRLFAIAKHIPDSKFKSIQVDVSSDAHRAGADWCLFRAAKLAGIRIAAAFENILDETALRVIRDSESEKTRTQGRVAAMCAFQRSLNGHYFRDSIRDLMPGIMKLAGATF